MLLQKAPYSIINSQKSLHDKASPSIIVLCPYGCSSSPASYSSQTSMPKPLGGLVISSYSINSGIDIQSVFIKGSVFGSRAHEEERVCEGRRKNDDEETQWRKTIA
jgi:hypothetical protein